jgi:hypothetical protein
MLLRMPAINILPQETLWANMEEWVGGSHNLTICFMRIRFASP